MYNIVMNKFVSISQARANLPTIVDTIKKNMDRVTITVNGQPDVVIISREELESIEETAEILAIPGAKESIEKGTKEAKKRLGIPLSELK